MARFRKEKAVDGEWSRWVTPVQDYKMACCDCGLVHNMQWRVLKVTDAHPDGMRFEAEEVPWGEYRIAIRVSRNKRSTAQLRRHMK